MTETERVTEAEMRLLNGANAQRDLLAELARSTAARLEEATAARAFIVRDLWTTYKLGPEDRIQPDGTITRAPAAAEGGQ